MEHRLAVDLHLSEAPIGTMMLKSEQERLIRQLEVEASRPPALPPRMTPAETSLMDLYKRPVVPRARVPEPLVIADPPVPCDHDYLPAAVHDSVARQRAIYREMSIEELDVVMAELAEVLRRERPGLGA